MLNRLNLNQACTGLVERYLGSAYDNVRLVAENLDELLAAAAKIKGTALQSVYVWTDVAGQQTFAFVHDPAALDLYLNGLHLTPGTYQSDGQNIVLEYPLETSVDNLVAVTSLEGDGLSDTAPIFYRQQIWSPAIGTTAFAFTHNPEYLSVYLNGSKLVEDADYTSSGTVITLTNPTANSGDTVEAISFDSFYIANALSREEASNTYLPRLEGIAVVDTCNSLIVTDHLTIPSNMAMTKGSITVGDGLADLYLYNTLSTAVVDGYDVIKPNSAFGGIGRWLRVGINNAA